MNGVIYARYSAGPNQTDQSIEGQIRDCKEYAEKNNIRIIDYYIDKHISGTDFLNRLEFNRLIRDAEKHQFSCVIVWKIDRFGRDRNELAINKVKLKKHGVTLHYAKEHIPEGPEGIILESVLEGMAEYYSAELSQKIRRGTYESALKGHSNVPCFGYNLVNKFYEINPDTAPIVPEIFERYASGEVAPDIARDLCRRGYKSVKGKTFTAKSIYYILRNENYIGTYRRSGVVKKDFIPPLVKEDVWNRVQEILAQNTRNRSHKRCTAPTEFLLTGKLYCGHCKETIIGESGTGRSKVYYYYKCSGRKNKETNCQMRTFKKYDLESAVIQHTLNDVLTDKLIEFLCDKVMELQAADLQSVLLKSMHKQAKSIQKSIDNIMKAIEAGIITDTTKDRLMELERQKESMSIEIAKEEIKKPDISKNQLLYWLYSFKYGDINDISFQTNIVNTFINSIYLYEDHMVIVYNFMNGEGSRKAIELDIESVDQKKNQPNLINNGSADSRQVRMTGIEPARSPTRS